MANFSRYSKLKRLQGMRYSNYRGIWVMETHLKSFLADKRTSNGARLRNLFVNKMFWNFLYIHWITSIYEILELKNQCQIKLSLFSIKKLRIFSVKNLIFARIKFREFSERRQFENFREGLYFARKANFAKIREI